ncbi:MAG: preprotein translocase subunit SecE, partial [Bdellovibrionales bacterium]|nr:preprotein translocase subunit SecE [Bdellovibrionales bacterium]
MASKSSSAKTATTKASNSTSESAGIVGQTVGFLNESVEELKKVSVPTRQETIQATIVTMIIMVFVALCLFLLDFLFGNL